MIGGPSDLSYFNQKKWIFDKKCYAYDTNGYLMTSFTYNKGKLEGDSYHYFQNGKIKKITPFQNDKINGEVLVFNEENEILEKTFYINGKKESEAFTYFKKDSLKSKEKYKNGLLLKGEYFLINGKCIAEIINKNGKKAIYENNELKKLVEYKEGTASGMVEVFEGNLHKTYHMEKGGKNGVEIEYYSDGVTPKLYMTWLNDIIHGKVKTYYQNGNIESEKEYSQNKKNGLSNAWYLDGGIMYMEEYENDYLKNGLYYKKNKKDPVSKVKNGKGTSILFSKEGIFLRSTKYIKGIPQDEERSF